MAKHVFAVALIAFLLQGMLFHVAPLTIASAVDNDFEHPWLQRVASAVDNDFEHPYLQRVASAIDNDFEQPYLQPAS